MGIPHDSEWVMLFTNHIHFYNKYFLLDIWYTMSRCSILSPICMQWCLFVCKWKKCKSHGIVYKKCDFVFTCHKSSYKGELELWYLLNASNNLITNMTTLCIYVEKYVCILRLGQVAKCSFEMFIIMPFIKILHHCTFVVYMPWKGSRMKVAKHMEELSYKSSVVFRCKAFVVNHRAWLYRYIIYISTINVFV